ncbi:MAG TPA: isochorismatase family protein [Pseudolabrys sp.]|nr:isochorismatase family protein [Pseudolabrys sp.]
MAKTNIVSLRPYVDPLTAPTVVMVDLQQEYVAAPRRMAVPNAEQALANCRTLLAHARTMGFPVAFTRRIGRAPFFNSATRFSHWIEGFLPLPTEMVFEREMPSCYDSEEFARVMDEGIGANIVLAGFAGESACLSTIVDAHHRAHRVTFLSDASASHALEGTDANDVHALLVKVLSLYGKVATTADWIDTTREWSFIRGVEYSSESHDCVR